MKSKKFINGIVWDGIKGGDMSEVYSRIGPSIAISKRAERTDVKKKRR